MTAISASRNQLAPRKMSPILTLSPATDFITKQWNPTGGVSIPTSTSFTTNIPTHNRFMSSSRQTGSKIGNVKSMTPIGSRNMPSTTKMMIMAISTSACESNSASTVAA